MGTQRCGGAPSLKLKNYRKSYGLKHNELKNVVFHMVSGKKQALGHVLSETSREALDSPKGLRGGLHRGSTEAQRGQGSKP